MDKRSERMLEEILKLSGNERCADCGTPAPRWASINLGIFICVGCASVHRKLGTHKSRVKSVTLDTWSREQLATMRQIGNTASNLIYNPDTRRNPPPTSSAGSDDRDGDLEKFIRRKYEQGAFKAGANSAAMAVPNSMNRARAAAGKEIPGMVRSTSWTSPNPRNPELNDVLIGKEKDLPRLPKPLNGAMTSQHSGPSQPPRQRPTPSRGNTPQPTGGSSGGASLIDMGEGVSATAPLQMTGYGGQGPYQAQAMGQGSYQSQGMGAGSFQSQGMGAGSFQSQGSWGNGQPNFTGSIQQPQYQAQPIYPTSYPYQSQPHPSYHSQSPSYQSQQNPSFQPQQHFQPQMGYQQPFLPVPQQQYGGMMSTSPNGMGQMGYPQGGMGTSPGQGMMMQGSPGNWQGVREWGC